MSVMPLDAIGVVRRAPAGDARDVRLEQELRGEFGDGRGILLGGMDRALQM